MRLNLGQQICVIHSQCAALWDLSAGVLIIENNAHQRGLTRAVSKLLYADCVRRYAQSRYTPHVTGCDLCSERSPPGLIFKSVYLRLKGVWKITSTLKLDTKYATARAEAALCCKF
jgi:hypothetical protein